MSGKDDSADSLIFVKLLLPEVKPADGFDACTRLLRDSHRFRTNTVLAFAAPSVTKGGIFSEINAPDRAYTLEVAIELQDLLPLPDGRSEAVLSVGVASGEHLSICVSNRMSRFHYSESEEATHVLMPRRAEWHGYAEVPAREGSSLTAAEEQLRSVVAMSFNVSGDSAEAATETNVRRCVEQLLESTNSLLRALRSVLPHSFPTSRALVWDSLPTCYLLVSSDQGVRVAILALNGGRAARVTTKLDGDKAQTVRSVLGGDSQINDVDQLLGDAWSSCEAGDYEFALLQAVIAAEIATARRVHAACLARGISATKLADNRKEMTYSWSLNIGLRLVLERAEQPSDALVGAMNEARRRRNALMHENTFCAARAEIRQLLSDTAEFIKILDAASPTVGQ